MAIAQGGGEKTDNAFYDTREDNNNVLGYPGISGTLEVKTQATWTLDGANVIDRATWLRLHTPLPASTLQR